MKLAIVISLLALFLVLGIGLYTTNFTAYLGNDPSTCNNCHVMDGVYENWYHGGHKNWTTCNDCHTPHEFIPKYLVKAESGYHHVTAFVFGKIPDAIRAKESSRQIVQKNCIRCHEETVANIVGAEMVFDRYCFDCHRSSAHGDRGITILPYQHTEENQ